MILLWISVSILLMSSVSGSEPPSNVDDSMKKTSIKSRCVFSILLLAVLATQSAIVLAEGEEEVTGYRKTVSVGASIGTVVPREDTSTSALGIDYYVSPQSEMGNRCAA